MKNEINITVNQQEKLKALLLSDNYKYWLGGFTEGEGALVASITRNPKTTNKYMIQPEFNVAQHESGINILYSFKLLFHNLGSVHKKSGSDKVWVFSIKGIENIIKHVIPFFDKYVLLYSSKYNEDNLKDYKTIVNKLFEQKNKTMDKKDLVELITLAYSLNIQGKGKQRKRSIDEIITDIYTE